MSVRITALTTPVQSTTGTLKRDVHDTIRHLFPGLPILALVTSGMAGTDGVKRERGLIGKRRVMAPRHECFTYSPQAIEFEVSARTSATEFSVSAASGLHPKLSLVNTTRNMATARISSVNTSTGAIVAVEVGDTSWDVVVGDKLLVMGTAYAENSSSPYILMKDPDNMYNFTQIQRYTCAISRTAKGNLHYGGNRWELTKAENVQEGMRKCELSMLFSNRASGTNETTSDATLSDSFRTMRGMWNWAQTTFDAGGAMTLQDFQQEVPNQMNETMGPEMKMCMFVGTKIYGLMQEWANDKNTVEQNMDGQYKTFGVEARNFYTARGMIRVIRHDAFDRADMAKSALIFSPEMNDYCHLRDDDFRLKAEIQNNDVDGVQAEILGEVAVTPRDAGYSTMQITNWW